MSFQSQIWVLAEKPNLGILLCRRTIRLGNNFQSIYLYFWSNLDQLIRLFATKFDLWSVLNVFDKVLSNPNSSDFCDLIKNGIRFAFFFDISHNEWRCWSTWKRWWSVKLQAEREEDRWWTKLYWKFSKRKEKAFFEIFTIWNLIYEQAMMIDDYSKNFDSFLGWL